MMYRVIKESEYDLINKLIKDNDNVYIFQTKTYLEKLSKLKYKFFYYGSYKEGVLESVIPVQYKKIPLIRKRYSFIPGGIIGKENQDFLEYALKDLKQNSLVVRLEYSNIISNTSYQLTSNHKTIEIDLNQDLELIFENFSKSNRNLVRRADKDGVIIEISKDIKYVNNFIDMYKEMIKNKDIDSLDLEFLEEVIISMIKDDLGFFALGKFESDIYNIAFVSVVGKRARYLYGASIRVEKRTPPIGQFLHYKIIKYLKENKYNIYDLGGIPHDIPAKEDSIYGVYKFKKGFGGIEVVDRFTYTYYRFKILKKVFK